MERFKQKNIYKQKYKWWEGIKLPDPIVDPYDVVWSHWAEVALTKNAITSTTMVYVFENDYTFKDVNKLFEFCTENGLSQFWELSRSGGIQKSFVWNDGMFILSQNQTTDQNSLRVKMITSDKIILEKYKMFFKTETVPKNDKKSIYVMTTTQDGPQLVDAGNANLALERSNYEENILFDYDYIVKQLNAEVPYGRLVIFNGTAGSGKTHIIKGLLDEVKNATFILIPPDMIVDLTGPNFIRPFLNLKHENDIEKNSVVLILEDADRVLVRRGNDNLAEINSLLNFGDGIFGSLFDIRIIATTNAKKLEMDPAIMRPGRLCRMTDVNELSPETANKVFLRLVGTDGKFDKKTTLAEVYKLANHSEWKMPEMNEEVGFKK